MREINWFAIAKNVCYGKNWCKSCGIEFTAKDPEEDLCPACKIDEAERRVQP